LDVWLINVLIETTYLKQDDWAYDTQKQVSAIGIKDGTIAAVLPMDQWIEDQTARILEGKNQLLLPGLVEKHCHLDKS